MTLVINYRKISDLHPLIRSLCHQGDGWIVGSAAKFLLDVKETIPGDWDIVIPFHYWKRASKSVPAETPANSHGGFKIILPDLVVDLWCGDVAEFLTETPDPPEYAVSLKAMRFLTCSREWYRVKTHPADG